MPVVNVGRDEHKQALESMWWIELCESEQHPHVRFAVARAIYDAWRLRIKKAFAANKISGAGITNTRELAEAINRECAASIYRMSGTEKDRETGDLHGRWMTGVLCAHLLMFAWILRVPVREFFIDEESWIEEATLILCENNISNLEARAYAKYRWNCPGTSNSFPFKPAIAKVRDDLALESDKDVIIAIQKVVHLLEIALQPH